MSDPLPLRAWLAGQRTQLNGRFRLARRRYPALNADVVLALCAELLPETACAVGDTPDLFGALFDLILLHAGRGLLAPNTPGIGEGSGGRSPALSVLFRRTFPRLGPLLALRPKQLPGALSNAVENLGPLGIDFATRLTSLAGKIHDPDLLLDVGAVLAWRLGDARLRTPALERAARIPPELFAELFDLTDWPAALRPLALEGLRREGWLRPEQLFSAAARAHPDPAAVAARLDEWDSQLGGAWVLAARLGNFVGFEGTFPEPPVLLDAGTHGSPHRFWLRAGGKVYRLDGDAYGSSCRHDPSAVYPVAPTGTDSTAPLPGTTSSVLTRPGCIAYTRPDSFRLRVLIQRRSL